MLWILPAIFVLVHTPNGDQPRAYQGVSQEQIQTSLLGEGRTFDFLTTEQYEAFVAANKTPPLTLAQLLAEIRAQAKVAISSGQEPISELQRAILLTIIDAFNASIQRERNMDADIAAATSLADLKARRVARPTVNDITPQQAKQAVQNKLDSGQAD